MLPVYLLCDFEMKNDEVMFENKTPLKYDGFCFCNAHTNFAICSYVNLRKFRVWYTL